jgi:hypothetical protein
MRQLRYNLITDGSSDRVLIPILTWLLKQHLREYMPVGQWIDFGEFNEPRRELADRIRWAAKLYACDLLFIHRDAEHSRFFDARYQEIKKALHDAFPDGEPVPTVCIVPIRMQEAWLLIDEAAIRKAASNPNGRAKLMLPRPADLEQEPDPKARLYELLRAASGLNGRKRNRFRPQKAAHLITEEIQDFSVLRQLSAFQRLESDLVDLISNTAWLSQLA